MTEDRQADAIELIAHAITARRICLEAMGLTVDVVKRRALWLDAVRHNQVARRIAGREARRGDTHASASLHAQESGRGFRAREMEC